MYSARITSGRGVVKNWGLLVPKRVIVADYGTVRSISREKKRRRKRKLIQNPMSPSSAVS